MEPRATLGRYLEATGRKGAVGHVVVREDAEGRWCLVKPAKEGTIEDPLPGQTDDPAALRDITEKVIGARLSSWEAAPGPQGRRAYVGEVDSGMSTLADAEEVLWESHDPLDQVSGIADMASGDPSDVVDGLLDLEDIPHTLRNLKDNAGRWARRLTRRQDKLQGDDPPSSPPT